MHNGECMKPHRRARADVQKCCTAQAVQLASLPCLRCGSRACNLSVAAGSLQYTSKHKTDLKHSAIRPLHVP